MRGTGRILGVISFMLVTAAGISAARAGVIAGSVKDEKSGEVLVGAAVGVVGTKLGAVADLDGKFTIQNVPAGIYSLRVIYSGYAQKVVAGVTVTGNETVQMNINLEPMSTEEGDAMRIDDIYVTAERVRNTAASVLVDQQRSAVIGNAISAEQIRLSPDGNSGDALKRVTGLSLVDDKFVFVRGVTDRYNATTLNDVVVTGTDTDSDKKSFNFDLIPASLMSNTVVVKSASPDLPGDFSGGLVQINTLDLPQELIATASIETGYDEASSHADVPAPAGGGSDWKAVDDGSRALPSGLEGNALAQSLPNTWGTSPGESPLNQSYGLAIGDHYQTGIGEFGFIGSGTYKTGFDVDEFHQEPYVELDGNREQLFVADGVRYKQKYLWSGLLNMTYRPQGNHTFSLENNYTRSADSKVTQAFGDPESDDSTRTQTIEWDQRDIYLGQLRGDHEFPDLRGLTLDWRVSYSTSDAQEPDRKFAAYTRVPTGVYILKENYRTWSNLQEDGHGVKLDFSYPVHEMNFKAGYLYSKRERSFDVTAYTTYTGNVSRANQSILLLPIDEVFAGENYGTSKLEFRPWSDLTGKYDGTFDLTAYYGMVETPFGVAGQRFRFAGGARIEDSDQIVDSPVSASIADIQTAQIKETDVLPSANLAYEVTSTTNLRLGYFQSVNRPEFREMANVAYIDFDANQGVIGNPDLERAKIDNYDVRLEWFPGVGEVLAVGYFYKELTDAIEEQLLVSPGRYVRTWFNSPTGKNYGYEIEVRKHLGFVWRDLEHLIVQGNYTHVASEVEYTESHNDPVTNEPVVETKQRTMQGQAPYTLNVGLIYSVPSVRLSMSLLYNRFGQRLDAVGDTRDYDVYEESRGVLDFALSEQFTNWMRLKFSIRDIAADDIVYTFGTTGSVWESVAVGTTYAISLAFNL